MEEPEFRSLAMQISELLTCKSIVEENPSSLSKYNVSGHSESFHSITWNLHLDCKEKKRSETFPEVHWSNISFT